MLRVAVWSGIGIPFPKKMSSKSAPLHPPVFVPLDMSFALPRALWLTVPFPCCAG